MCHNLKPDPEIIKVNVLTNFYQDEVKLWLQTYTQGFSKIWPSDLVFFFFFTLYDQDLHLNYITYVLKKNILLFYSCKGYIIHIIRDFELNVVH